MTPETRERFAVLVERRLVGLSGAAETDELSSLLEESAEARELYLRAVEFHVDLGVLRQCAAVVPFQEPRPQVPRKSFAAWWVAAAILLVAVSVAIWAGGSDPIPTGQPMALEQRPTATKAMKPLQPPPSPEAVPVDVPSKGLVEIPPGLLEGVRREFSQLTPGYRSYMAVEDHQRLAQLEATTRATPEDIQWLNTRVLGEYVLAFKRDAADIFSQDVALRKTFSEAPGVVITRKNGTIIEGQIHEETAAAVKIKTRFGLANIPWDDIERFAKTSVVRLLFLQLLEEADRDLEKLSALLAWCQLKNLKLEKEFVAYDVLTMDASNDRARSAVGLTRPSISGLSRPPAMPGDVPPKELVQIPGDVLDALRDGFSRVTPGYRSFMTPAELQRLGNLETVKKGTPEDLSWLKTRVLNEMIPAFQREAELIRSQVLALEPKLKENAATDVIIRKNGTKVEGQIVSQTETEVKIKTRFGAASIPAAEITRIEKGKGAGTEFPARYTEAKGNIEKLVPLLAWCAEKNLKLEKDFVAYHVLMMDASNGKARSAVGLARPSIGGLSQPSTVPETLKVSGIEKTIEIIANDVVSRNQAFPDVVVEMRRRTEGLTTTSMPVPPAKSVKGASKIQNPLTFDAARMPVPDAVEIGTWWSQLLPDERREFARYYGLWCAFMREHK